MSTGGDSLRRSASQRTALRQTLRQSSRPPGGAIAATSDNEELRAQLKSAKYEIESLRQDRQEAEVRHEKELRDVQARAEADFKKAQASDSHKRATHNRNENLAKELHDLQTRAANEKQTLEKRLRSELEKRKELEEDVAEARSELTSSQRHEKHRFDELEKKHDALQRTMREIRSELDLKSSNLDATQARLKSKEAETGELEAEILQLKASGGDSDELATIRTQLSDQVEYVRKLEMTNREQLTELRTLRQGQKAVKILEEEKRTLQLKLGKLDDLEKELDEAKFQRQLLEDERQAWAAYLQSEGDEGTEFGFDSPEAMARALRDERIERASLLDRLGVAEPLVMEKDGLIRSLEEDKAKLQVEVSKLKSSGAAAGSGSSRAQARLERQKALAIKEIEYLREQLKTFDAEDITGEVKTEAETSASDRISQLEQLVSQYRAELETANTQLNSAEAPLPAPTLKRPAPDSESEAAAAAASSAQVGELSRKVRALQQELAAAQTSQSTLSSDNGALRTQLSALQATSRTRVLSLRSNPTDDFEARKQSNIALLRRENAALRAQLEGRVGSRRKGDVVPAESLEEARLQIDDALAQVRSREKHHERLKQVFAVKGHEMREAIASLLGWNVEFLPNGKFRLTSIFADEGREGNREKVERHITFSGDGMMAIAGGPNGEFAREMAGLIRFWVEERNEIPGFLAAMTLENLDRVQGTRGEDDD